MVELRGVGIADAPILLLSCFHKSLRAELAHLRQLTSSWVETLCPGRDSLVQFLHRFRFLRLVYKYHCDSEDEVIFQALDARAGNVACTYCLEHSGISGLFNSVFQSLNILLEEDGKFCKQFQTLAFCMETIDISINQHMLKEEEQVFPLLIQQFSFKEQAALVWQFMCSVPIILLEDFLPWMISYLPTDEQADAIHCIKEVFPKDNVLQEVVSSWLNRKSEPSVSNLNAITNDEVASSFDDSLYWKKFQKVYSSWVSLYGEKCTRGDLNCHQDNGKPHPVDGLCLWNGAIKKDLEEILEELHEIRGSKVFSTLASISAQIKFFADVLIFYSDALEKVFFSALSELENRCSFSYQRFPKDIWIDGLLRLLKDINFEDEISLGKLVENLCLELETFLAGLGNHFTFQETEVFPLIRKHCKCEAQQKLLYTSLHMMPLGLLKFVITWLSSHLTEDELKAFLCSIKLAGSDADVSFASLLHEWVRIGYSGKTSFEKFRQELQDMFRNRSSFLSEQVENSGFSADLDVGSCERVIPGQVKPNSAIKVKKSASDSISNDVEDKNITLYSGAINVHILFPDCLKELSPFSKYLAEKSDAGSSLCPEFKPIDYIFLFHKALKKDLSFLVHVSAEMVENVDFLLEFRQRFQLIQFLYRVHSANEDEIAFPALEAKGQLKNISISYTIEHKLEVEHFNNISTTLDEISQLTVSHPSATPTVVDQNMMKYRRLCMKIHGTCKTMCIMLGKHFQCEEIELWPLFTEHFSSEEQEEIIGSILGRTRAEVLQKMIPWLMASLTSAEQHALMSLWCKATKNTNFNEWLREWWEGMSRHDLETVVESNTLPSRTTDPLEIAAAYLTEEGNSKLDDIKRLTCLSSNSESSGNVDGFNETKFLNGDVDNNQCPDCNELHKQGCKESDQKVMELKDQVKQPCQLSLASQKLSDHEEHFLTMSQEDLEAAIRRVSRNSALNPKEKSHIIQNLLMSRWIVRKQRSHQRVTLSSSNGEIPGQYPSYRDSITFGCKHYKRNCKLFAACCNKLFTCKYCHDDEEVDHSIDRKVITKMMCMKCLKVQPIGATCSNISCNGLSMAKYFCNICRLYDDEREIYHCPYCNLCRLGKGLGIEYFHCMKCNACMSKSLSLHVCRAKGFESNCPICHEDIFTSSSPVKALPCGHSMHSTCFQDYTCTYYTCPICSKSLGDMQVYFLMLDALLAEEKFPQEYHGQTQVIFCNDCEKRGVAPYHWLYHKCCHCGSYNTRLN